MSTWLSTINAARNAPKDGPGKETKAEKAARLKSAKIAAEADASQREIDEKEMNTYANKVASDNITKESDKAAEEDKQKELDAFNKK